MRSRRSLTIAVALGLVAAAATAVILLNLALLGYAQPRNDPVGKLSPRAVLPGGPPRTQPANTTTTTDSDAPENEGNDD